MFGLGKKHDEQVKRPVKPFPDCHHKLEHEERLDNGYTIHVTACRHEAEENAVWFHYSVFNPCDEKVKEEERLLSSDHKVEDGLKKGVDDARRHAAGYGGVPGKKEDEIGQKTEI